MSDSRLMLRFDVLPGHCLAIMLAAWRGQSLVPATGIVGLERAFDPSRHPELVRDAIHAAEAAMREPAKVDPMVLECSA